MKILEQEERERENNATDARAMSILVKRQVRRQAFSGRRRAARRDQLPLVTRFSCYEDDLPISVSSNHFVAAPLHFTCPHATPLE